MESSDAEPIQSRAPVSVVVPCYRCANTISRAVASVHDQTLKPSEVILIDDGSGDETMVQLRSLAKEYGENWIKVFSLEENSGPSSARNLGWGKARFDYVAFLDADDTWHPEKIRIQLDFMNHNKDIALSGHFCSWYGQQDESVEIGSGYKTTIIEADDLLFRNAFSTPTVMLRTSLPFRFLMGRYYAEDFLLWLKIAYSGNRIARIELPLAQIYKAPYGAAGLSANLLAMEIGELSNYWLLYSEEKINGWKCLTACALSLAKFMKRIIAILPLWRRG